MLYKQKLNAIEASATADQTDAEIRAAVEAASDSNVFTDADHTKLNGIEASATADQTDAEIRAAVEAASDSNVFTDADHTKLNGIATSATANPNAIDNVVEDTTPQLGGDLASNGNDILIADNDRIKFGSDNDLHIYHNGSDSVINSITGGLEIKDTGGFMRIRSDELKIQAATGNENYIECDLNGAVQLFFDNSKKFETTTDGVTITGDLFLDNPSTAGRDIKFDVSDNALKISDNVNLNFGDGNDLKLYHDGSNSTITNTTGDLYITDSGGNIYIQSKAGEQSIVAFADGAVDLYHNNSKKV